MKQFNKLFFLLVATFLASNISAQERYLEEVFSSVNVESDITYATNIEVLTGSPLPKELKMDVYTPVGDEETNRPVVVYFHTGSFLPAIINGQVTGTKTDSTVAEICRRLARQGYVAISATYRAGWNPTALGADGQDVRTGTLLNAAYRGIQDARALIRFLRKDIAEGSNQFGVDAERITLWGQGTGGYISYGAAYLDNFSELDLDKFYDQNLELYVDSSLVGGVYGENNAIINIGNHPGYSSEFKLAVNIGGALGDTSWIDGTVNEPPTIGFHMASDPFAPYVDGAVIVPTTGDFVVNVSGTRRVTQMANDNGSNAVFQVANDDLNDPINALNKVYQTLPGQGGLTLSTDNMFPFVTNGPASGYWEWWDFPTLAATVDFINSLRPPAAAIDAVALDSTSRILNPNMSKEQAMRYIDTIMAYFNPRAYLALNLTTSTKEILSAETVELTVGPNPVSDVAFIRTAPDKPMKSVALYHMNGKMMRGIMNVNSSTFELHRQNLPPGIYILQAEFEEGVVAKKLVFN
ncbi:MAG TPA: T9SS type A sorting domain-containing protein [Saprospiraceae bacterium]|nr:T9SS type A sorting domain-containing protein [Saprospiraceae bacterium]